MYDTLSNKQCGYRKNTQKSSFVLSTTATTTVAPSHPLPYLPPPLSSYQHCRYYYASMYCMEERVKFFICEKVHQSLGHRGEGGGGDISPIPTVPTTATPPMHVARSRGSSGGGERGGIEEEQDYIDTTHVMIVHGTRPRLLMLLILKY